jgi:hypothetical protein
VRYQRQPGTSWLRYAPQHLHCRGCGVEIRAVPTRLGYAIWAVVLGLFGVACLVILSPHSMGGLESYRVVAAVACVLICVPLGLVQARWGTMIVLVPNGTTHEQHAL